MRHRHHAAAPHRGGGRPGSLDARHVVQLTDRAGARDHRRRQHRLVRVDDGRVGTRRQAAEGHVGDPAGDELDGAGARQVGPAGRPQQRDACGRPHVPRDEETQRGHHRVADHGVLHRHAGHDLTPRRRRAGHHEVGTGGCETVDRRVLHVRTDPAAGRRDVQREPTLLRSDAAEDDDALGARGDEEPLPAEVHGPGRTPRLQGHLGGRRAGVGQDQLSGAGQVGGTAEKPGVRGRLLAGRRGQTPQVTGGHHPGRRRRDPGGRAARLGADDLRCRDARQHRGAAAGGQRRGRRRAVQRTDAARGAVAAVEHRRHGGDGRDRVDGRRIEGGVAATGVVGEQQRTCAHQGRRRRRDGGAAGGYRGVVAAGEPGARHDHRHREAEHREAGHGPRRATEPHLRPRGCGAAAPLGRAHVRTPRRRRTGTARRTVTSVTTPSTTSHSVRSGLA